MLSIHQSDVVVYGANVRAYLTNELSYAFPGEQRTSDYDTAFWGELVG